MKYFLQKTTVYFDNFLDENYGVMALGEDDKKEYYCDISRDANSIELFVGDLNKYHIEPCHLKDVIEDFKFDQSLLKV